MSVSFTINGVKKTLDIEPDTPLLWAIRDHIQLTGTKFGCGLGQCGACTVHVNGQVTRSCITPVSALEGASITTIEGLQSETAKAVQTAWSSESVVQCGYCQSGQIMAATALLKENPNPDDDAIDAFMSGNICRCATYGRIRKAIKKAAQQLTQEA